MCGERRVSVSRERAHGTVCGEALRIPFFPCLWLGTVPWSGHGRRGACTALDYETPLDRCTDDTSFLCQSDSSTVFRHRSLSLTNPHTFWLAQTCLLAKRGNCPTPTSAISNTVITRRFSPVFLFLDLPSLSTHCVANRIPTPAGIGGGRRALPQPSCRRGSPASRIS